jgi:Family of unknown function (DUF6492)
LRVLLKGTRQMLTAEKPLDIVIKTRARDLVPFLQLQTDLASHSRLHGRVYVIVPRQELDQFSDLVEKGSTLLTAEEVAGAAGHIAEFPDTWFTQQIIKIIAANVIDHEYYLILDSNTLLGFDFDEQFFVSHGEYVYAVNEFRDVAWELQSRNFLRLHAPCRLAGFRAANQIFSKRNAHALIRHVESLYNDSIVRILLRYSDDLNTQFWTEFALYGVFVQSMQGPPGHCFEERADLVHFSARRDFTQFLQAIEEEAPLMIKFNKRRPRQYDLTVGEYARRVSEIKKAYQRRLKVRAAR